MLVGSLDRRRFDLQQYWAFCWTVCTALVSGKRAQLYWKFWRVSYARKECCKEFPQLRISRIYAQLPLETSWVSPPLVWLLVPDFYGYFCLFFVLLISQCSVSEIDAFFLKWVLWHPTSPPHPVIIIRLVLWWGWCQPAIYELYEYINNPYTSHPPAPPPLPPRFSYLSLQGIKNASEHFCGWQLPFPRPNRFSFLSCAKVSSLTFMATRLLWFGPGESGCVPSAYSPFYTSTFSKSTCAPPPPNPALSQVKMKAKKKWLILRSW